MKKNINIAIVGLGQIGIYLYNELNLKKNEIEKKTGKKINKYLFILNPHLYQSFLKYSYSE